MIVYATAVTAASGTTAARTIEVAAPAEAETGDLLLLFVGITDNSAAATSITGWTPLLQNYQAGTQRTSVYSRVREAGDTTYTLDLTGTTSTKHAVVAVRGWTGSLIVGTLGRRADGQGTATTTVAPGITMTGAGTTILFSAERTNATEPEPTNDSGFATVAWASGDISSPVSLLVGQKTTAAGAVGPATTTYPNSSAANGSAIMIGILEAPPAPTGPQVFVGGVECYAWRWNGTSHERVTLELAGL